MRHETMVKENFGIHPVPFFWLMILIAAIYDYKILALNCPKMLQSLQPQSSALPVPSLPCVDMNAILKCYLGMLYLYIIHLFTVVTYAHTHYHSYNSALLLCKHRVINFRKYNILQWGKNDCRDGVSNKIIPQFMRNVDQWCQFAASKQTHSTNLWCHWRMIPLYLCFCFVWYFSNIIFLCISAAKASCKFKQKYILYAFGISGVGVCVCMLFVHAYECSRNLDLLFIFYIPDKYLYEYQ